MKAEVVRKVAHAALAVFFGIVGPAFELHTILLVAVVLFLVFSVVRSMKLFRFFQRASYTSYGEFLFVGGIAVTAILFLPDKAVAFQIGMFILAFADTAASVVGTRFGKHVYHVLGEKRSYEGSVACFVVAVWILLFFGMEMYTALIVGALLATIEALSPSGSDNLLLPVAAGIFASVVL